MSAAPSPLVDRAIGCAIAVGVLCMTLLIVGFILVNAAE